VLHRPNLPVPVHRPPNLGRFFKEALPRILRWLAARVSGPSLVLFQFRRKEHIPWKSDCDARGAQLSWAPDLQDLGSQTDEQRSIRPSQPKDDGKCTLKTRPKTHRRVLFIRPTLIQSRQSGSSALPNHGRAVVLHRPYPHVPVHRPPNLNRQKD
jgi:hypothetical protein